MSTQAQVLDLHTPAGIQAATGYRPFFARNGNKNAFGRIRTNRGLVVQSLLRKDEWEELDREVIQAARLRLKMAGHLMERGLVHRLGSIGTLVSQWNLGSEMGQAQVSLSGRAKAEQDVQDFNLAGVPVPIIFKDFDLGSRTMEAARRMGEQIDMTNAAEAGRVVAEMLETIIVDGASVTLNGATIYGYTNQPYRNTDTATNYGGGDWGTIANIRATVIGMINAANADRHYGPFGLYAAPTQYNQALERHTDGSGEMALDTVLKLPQIEFFEPGDFLADGEVLLVQLTKDVVDLALLDTQIQVLEWMSGDGMLGHFKVMMVAVPRVKNDYNQRSGVVHATGA